jgi:hypothetical protein
MQEKEVETAKQKKEKILILRLRTVAKLVKKHYTG